jgi:hypothetical protein
MGNGRLRLQKGRILKLGD